MNKEHAYQMLDEGIELILKAARELEAVGGECAMYAHDIDTARLILDPVCQKLTYELHPEVYEDYDPIDIDDIPF